MQRAGVALGKSGGFQGLGIWYFGVGRGGGAGVGRERCDAESKTEIRCCYNADCPSYITMLTVLPI